MRSASPISRPRGEERRVPDEPTDAPARLAAIQRALQRLATSPRAPEEAFAALVAGGAHPEDARALAASPPARLGVYGGLIGGTIARAIENQLPRTSARLSALGRLHDDTRRFLDESPPRSHYLRDVPFEFAQWAAAVWAADPEVPPFVPELARFELLEFAVGTAERGPGVPRREELAADRGVALEGTAHVARFRYAVHLLPEDPADRSEPERLDVALLVYRDGANEVRQIALTPLAMQILERLLGARAPLGRAVEEGCRALGGAVDQEAIDGVARLLSGLAERGVVLGAAPPGAPEGVPTSPFRGWLTGGG
jgi:hypothetical protein